MLRASSRLGEDSLECSPGLWRRIAQLVEHRSPKPGVVGSSPSSPAICGSLGLLGRSVLKVGVQTYKEQIGCL